MTGHLCLKWNNHSSAFVYSISNIQTKEKYSDATVICQGQYFSVHRVVLSTCSEYFEEMFERIQCQHPYIVFKDIEPKEMELLLNYMYQGEVNVIQESLPNLIKAAEALKIKGLAVPDDIPLAKDSSKKRGLSNNETPASKRRLEDKKRKTDSPSISQNNSEISEEQKSKDIQSVMAFENIEGKLIKNEPEEFGFDNESISHPLRENESNFNKEENAFADVSASDLKTETDVTQVQSDVSATNSGDYDDQPFFQSLSLGEFPNCTEEDISSDIPNQDANHKNFFESLPLVLSDFSSIVNQRFFSTTNTTSTTTTTTTSSSATTSRVTDRSHQCPFCLFKSQYKHVIVRHVKFKHTGERPHGCTMCSSRFVSASDLQRHLYTHRVENTFLCRYCSLKFKNKNAYKLHVSDCLKFQQSS